MLILTSSLNNSDASILPNPGQPRQILPFRRALVALHSATGIYERGSRQASAYADSATSRGSLPCALARIHARGALGLRVHARRDAESLQRAGRGLPHQPFSALFQRGREVLPDQRHRSYPCFHRRRDSINTVALYPVTPWIVADRFSSCSAGKSPACPAREDTRTLYKRQ